MIQFQTEFIETALHAGILLLQYGAQTQDVEESISKLLKICNIKDYTVVILPYTIILNVNIDDKTVTKIKRAPKQEVNFSIITEIHRITNQIELNPKEIKKALIRLKHIHLLHLNYPPILKIVASALACAFISQLIESSLIVFLITFIASSSGMVVRIMLSNNQVNPFLVVIITSFVTTLISSFFVKLFYVSHVPISSAVLMLVPGVPLINAFEDMLKAHYTNAISRGIRGILISLGIALGMMSAISIVGI
ncbi:MAG: threonine/serine exporter family protein [Campylobacterales bacterium]|nr:threonine/serine exporter family protein [Campylobacterales bacterium]